MLFLFESSLSASVAAHISRHMLDCVSAIVYRRTELCQATHLVQLLNHLWV
jgi:hypothetical protein